MNKGVLVILFFLQSVQTGEMPPIDDAVRRLEERKERIVNDQTLAKEQKSQLFVSFDKKIEQFFKMKRLAQR